MAIRRVLYQSVFWAPFAPAAIAIAFTPFDAPKAHTYSAAEQQFSAWHSPFFGTKTPITPDYTAFDQARAPQYSAAEQQFSAWHSPFFGTKTPITPEWTAFDQARAPQFAAAQQQFSAYPGTFTPPTTTLIQAFTSTQFDEPQAVKFSAAQQQFATNAVLPPAQIAASGGWDAPPDQLRNVEVYHQFGAWHSFVAPASAPTLIAAFTSTPFDAPVGLQYKAPEQQFTSYTGFTPPGIIASPNTPFDVAKGVPYAASEQQFTAWHSPFFGTRTPNYAAGFVPFDTPRAPQIAAAQQQFSANIGFVFVPAGPTPNYLSTFTPFDEPVRLTIPPALLQFIDFGMGPEVTTAAPATIGRWGPDETKEERKRRHKAGIFFQDEEMPARSDFAPDPVEHPPHEPQKWADEPAAVRTGAKASSVSGVEHLAAILADVPDETWDDPDILELVEKFLENGWRR